MKSPQKIWQTNLMAKKHSHDYDSSDVDYILDDELEEIFMDAIGEI